MKKLIALTALFAISAPAIADPVCTQVSELAALVMKNRQNGVTLANALPIAGDSKLLQRMVIDAYQQGAMRSPDNIIRQQQDYANKWMLDCLRNRK